ncbi:uncharacterized protein PFL1_03758 [Pseudozyma flocculosa PF-1]|uniref:Uncharacterized protein n=2 Tax=Pseudozyma flocculosa TaxID=84751 RepID=A0A5C3EWD9_9BASI|nr:uncharacterized protein PFL1_03758 [Pseudozyma flocculosa PF-1]EPQ28455.1 hypothetical protein PFL1_03758 [Pseudozyma flocculosa PF-1]SPO36372.1 uncharacterized protein PSFLO_01843 [Pseudozyma flocculosa]
MATSSSRGAGRSWTKEEVIKLFHMVYERKPLSAKAAAEMLGRTEMSCTLKVVNLHKVIEDLVGQWAESGSASTSIKVKPKKRKIKKDE